MSHPFGRLIKHTRERQQRSLRETARGLGVSHVYLSEVESGCQGPLSIENTRKLAAYFNIAPEPLIQAALLSPTMFKLPNHNLPPQQAMLEVALVTHWHTLTLTQIEALLAIVTP